MPAAGWIKENTDAEPFSDVADCTRGELRLAAEVALAELSGGQVPTFAHERAVATLEAVAS